MGWELQRSLAVLVELVVPVVLVVLVVLDFVTAQIQSTNRSTSLVLFASSLHSRTRVKNDSCAVTRADKSDKRSTLLTS